METEPEIILFDQPETEPEVKIVEKRKLLTFRLDDQLFGLPLACAQECVELTEVTKIPLAPRAVRGLFHRQGRTVTLVHVEPAVGKPIPDRLSSASAIIVLLEGVVVAIPAQDIRPGSVTVDGLRAHPSRGALPALDERHEDGTILLHPGRLLAVLKQKIEFQKTKAATNLKN